MSRDSVNFLKTTNARKIATKEVFVLRDIVIVIMGLVGMNAR